MHRYKSLISSDMKQAPGVEITPLKRILAVMIPVVLVLA